MSKQSDRDNWSWLLLVVGGVIATGLYYAFIWPFQKLWFGLGDLYHRFMRWWFPGIP